jgi:antitoxin YefM
MTRMDSVPFTQAKAKLSELVDRVEREHARLAVTRHGRTAAVLINEDDLESLEETVAILRDEELVRSIRRSRKEATAGKRSALERGE